MKAIIREFFSQAFGVAMKVYHSLVPRFHVTRKLYGIRYSLNINDHISFIVSPFDWEPHIKEVVTRKWGVVWDVGSNFGLFSILAEKAGNRVIAFDPSELAIHHLNKSKQMNRCTNLTTISKPLTPEKKRYKTVDGAGCTTVLSPLLSHANGLEAMTYWQAAAEYGVPNLIKMDIEGGEREFLEHPGFVKWLYENQVSLIVELHSGYFPHLLERAHVRELSGHHIFYEPCKK